MPLPEPLYETDYRYLSTQTFNGDKTVQIMKMFKYMTIENVPDTVSVPASQMNEKIISIDKISKTQSALLFNLTL